MSFHLMYNTWYFEQCIFSKLKKIVHGSRMYFLHFSTSIQVTIFFFFLFFKFYTEWVNFFLSVQFVHTLLVKIPDKLSTRSDNEAKINLELSINLSLFEIVLPWLHFFLIGTEKVIFFHIFSFTFKLTFKFFC